VLVDAGFVGEGVVADDGFVALDNHAGEVRDEPARGREIGSNLNKAESGNGSSLTKKQNRKAKQ